MLAIEACQLDNREDDKSDNTTNTSLEPRILAGIHETFRISGVDRSESGHIARRACVIERSESDKVGHNEADNCDVERADPDVADGDTKEAPHA